MRTIAFSFFALVLSAGVALARVGATTTDLGLHAGPSSNTDLLITIPGGAKVYVGAYSGSWCEVRWRGYSGYVAKSGLAISAGAVPRVAVRPASPPPPIPIFPPYPYRAGHYPKADW